MYQFISRIATASALFLLSSTAWAGGGFGTLTYGPVLAPPPPVTAATPVPTLSGIMLMVMALLLAAIGYRILKQKDNNASRMMMLSLIAVGSLASGMSGIKLINDAYAAPLNDHPLDTQGQASVEDGLNNYNNVGTPDIEIYTVDVDQYCGVQGNPGDCVVGTILQNGQTCTLECFPG